MPISVPRANGALEVLPPRFRLPIRRCISYRRDGVGYLLPSTDTPGVWLSLETVEFSDGEIESMAMSKAEARAKAEHCFGPDVITETLKKGLSFRWTRMP
jgi:hypothetical protein